MTITPHVRRIGLSIALAVVPACTSDTTGPDGTPDDTDQTPPTVTITSPAAGAEVAPLSSTLVTGTASDDVGVTQVSVTVNGQTVVATGTTSWSVQLTAGEAGPINLSAVARDAAGNTSVAATRTLNIAEGWAQLGETMAGVTAVALASDGNRLMRLPCRAVSNRDEGEPAEYISGSWQVFASLTNECHDPAMDLEGDLWVATFTNDSDNVFFGSNINGPPVVVGPPTRLVNQWGVDAAIAQGTGYNSFVSRYSDGAPFGTLMLHIRMPLGPADSNELNGGWGRLVGTGHGLETALTGDASGWYVVFEQAGNLYVNRGAVEGGQSVDEEIGGGFSLAGQPQGPDIVLYQGSPVVSFLDRGRSTVVIAQWTGSAWNAIGTADASAGFVGRTRMAVDGNDLYVMTVFFDDDPRLIVDRWDGTAWNGLPSPLDAGETPSATDGDIVVYQGRPVVAYLAGGLKVKTLLGG